MISLAICRFSPGRSPHGERGLKCVGKVLHAVLSASLSSWRAWIEINRECALSVVVLSLSSWRAWIEIWRWCSPRPAVSRVALLMESVD